MGEKSLDEPDTIVGTLAAYGLNEGSLRLIQNYL